MREILIGLVLMLIPLVCLHLLSRWERARQRRREQDAGPNPPVYGPSLEELLANARYVGEAAIGEKRLGWMECIDYIEANAKMQGGLRVRTAAEWQVRLRPDHGRPEVVHVTMSCHAKTLDVERLAKDLRDLAQTY